MFSETAWPSADDAAVAVIGSALLDQNLAEVAVGIVRPDDFLEAASAGETYAAVWKAITSLVNRGKRAAPVLVANEVKRLGIAPRHADGAQWDLGEFLSKATAYHAAGVAVEEYSRILHHYGVRRRLRLLGHRLVDLSGNDQFTTPELFAEAETIFAEATSKGTGTNNIHHMGETTKGRLAMHTEREAGSYPGLKTGFKALDRKLRGMQPGDLIILAARPSMGKSALAQDIGSNVAKAGGTVIFVSREMSPEQLADRLIAAEGGVNAGDLRAGLVPKDRLAQAEAQLARDGLLNAQYFVDDQSRTVPEIRTAATRTKRKHGLDLIIVDYLQLLYGTGKYAKSGNRVQEVGEVSRGLKAMAAELEVPVIALSQLSRAVENRKDDDGKHRPQLSDLRDSGDIEQDADVITFLYRDAYYTKSTTDRTAEVIIAKNRNGPLGTVELEFIGERATFLSKE